MRTSIEAITDQPRRPDGERWPINPIRAFGHLDVELLGIRLARVRLDLTIAAVDRFLDFIRTTDAEQSPDLAALSRGELYRLAQDAEIDGRSGMSRAELIEALDR